MKTKKGISLIVLVITIIVMIILASAVIITLSSNGIIDKAKEAVDKTNEAQVQELATLGWLEAYNAGKRDEAELETAVKEYLAKNNITEDVLDNYGMDVTTSGVTVVKGWIQDGLTVKRGNTTLNVGDTIVYDETKGGTVDVAVDTNWQVLGAEDGNLLILSTDTVSTGFSLGSTTDLEEAKTDYITGVQQLNALCEPYKYGEGAVDARCITLEDVEKISSLDFDKTTSLKGFIEEYGNEVTYTWGTGTSPDYSASNNKTGTLTTEHNGSFIYFNGTEFVTLTKEANADMSVTLKNGFYEQFYSLSTVNNDPALKMLFGSGYYMLATPCISIYSTRVSYAFIDVWGNSCFGESTLLYSTGTCSASSSQPRAVVLISPEVTLTGSSEAGWTI